MKQAVRGQRVAEVIGTKLREDIINGALSPGTQLIETELADAYQISRNSVREVLHTLVRDGLATAERYRGVFVRTFCENDLADIYIARRTIQMQAIRCGAAYDQTILSGMARVLSRAHAALENEQWQDVGTLSLAFHQLQVSVLGSNLIDQFFLNICAQLRLIFTIGPDERIVQKPMWVERERRIMEYLEAGKFKQAESELDDYLTQSQRELTGIVRRYQPKSRFPGLSE